MRKTGGNMVGKAAQKLFTNSTTYPQAVFGVRGLSTTMPVTPSLYEAASQFCTQQNSGFNSVFQRLITTIHRPNNDSNKGR